MNSLSSTIKSADWKSEKHVPVITLPEGAKPGEAFDAEVAVGKEILHPNTPTHHIARIALHFVPAGASTSIELGRAWFTAHGDSMDPEKPGPAPRPSRDSESSFPAPERSTRSRTATCMGCGSRRLRCSGRCRAIRHDSVSMVRLRRTS